MQHYSNAETVVENAMVHKQLRYGAQTVVSLRIPPADVQTLLMFL